MSILRAAYRFWADHNLGAQNKVSHKIKTKFPKWHVTLILEYKTMSSENWVKYGYIIGIAWH